jgi:2'-5' RNA ligase
LEKPPRESATTNADGPSRLRDHDLSLPPVGSFDCVNRTAVPAMIALYPAPEQAQSIADDFSGDVDDPSDLHVTMAYLGTDLHTPEAQHRMFLAVQQAAAMSPALQGVVSGYGRFAGEQEDVLWAAVDVHGLDTLRATVADAVQRCGLEADTTHGWTPHMTLATYDVSHPGKRPRRLAGSPLTFDRLSLVIGGERVDVKLGGDPAAPEVQLVKRAPISEPTPAAELSFMRKEASRRFTLAPWYVPDTLDAHGEWATPDDVQQALWGYVDSGDRDVRLQHDRTVSAGRWVEAVTWPYEVELPMQQASGTVTKETYPPGTVFLGVVWEPWSWELVQKGMVTGLSIGGKAARVSTPMTKEVGAVIGSDVQVEQADV